MSEEQKAKIRAAKAANPYKPTSDVIAQRVLKQTGQKRNAETKLKMSLAAKGKIKGPMSEETKQKISNTTKGKPKSLECTLKKTETLKQLAAEGKHHSMVKVSCHHCSKSVTKLVYGRLHGDRCSQRPA